MPEHRRHEVARGPVGALAALAHASRCEGLELIKRHHDGLFVRFDDARVIGHGRGNRDGLGGENVKS